MPGLIEGLIKGLTGGIGQEIYRESDRQRHMDRVAKEHEAQFWTQALPHVREDPAAKEAVLGRIFDIWGDMSGGGKGKGKKQLEPAKQFISQLLNTQFDSGKGREAGGQDMSAPAELGETQTQQNMSFGPGMLAGLEAPDVSGVPGGLVDVPGAASAPKVTGPSTKGPFYSQAEETERAASRAYSLGQATEMGRSGPIMNREQMKMALKLAEDQAKVKARKQIYDDAIAANYDPATAVSLANGTALAAGNMRPTVTKGLINPVTKKRATQFRYADGKVEYVDEDTTKLGANPVVIRDQVDANGKPVMEIRNPDGKVEIKPQWHPKPKATGDGSGSGSGSAGEKDEIALIGDAIISGEQPPNLTSMYKKAPALKAYLAKRHYNLAQASLDWKGVERHMASMNSAGQLRLRQATEFAFESLDLIDQLNDDAKAKIPRSDRFPIWNKGAMAASLSGMLGKEAQEAARQLDIQIKDLQSELAVVYKGGNSPTDIGLKQAMDLLSKDWTHSDLKKAVELSRKNLRLRINSIKQTGASGVRQGSAYMQGRGSGTETLENNAKDAGQEFDWDPKTRKAVPRPVVR